MENSGKKKNAKEKMKKRKKKSKKDEKFDIKERTRRTDDRGFPEFSLFMKICFPLQCCWCWMCPLLCIGCCKPLNFDHVYPIEDSQYRCNKYEEPFKKLWKYFSFLSGVKLRLIATLYLLFSPEYLASGLIKLFSTVLVAVFPQFLRLFLLSLNERLDDEKQAEIDEKSLLVPADLQPTQSYLDDTYRSNDWEIWIWLAVLISMQVVAYITQNYSYYLANRVGLKMRVLLMLQIYKKVFSMSNSAREKRDKGEVLNFLAYDCYIIDMGHGHVWDVITSFVYVAIAAYFLVTLMGYSVLFAFLLFFILLFIMMFGMAGIFIMRFVNLKVMDRRVLHMKETFLNILQVKFFNRERIQKRKIQKYRRLEILILRILFLFRSFVNGVAYCTPPILIIVAFVIYYAYEGEIDDVVLLTSITYFTMLRQPLGSISINLASYMHALAALRRIQSFLEEEDRIEEKVLLKQELKKDVLEILEDYKNDIDIRIKGSFKYPTPGEDHLDETFKKIPQFVKKGEQEEEEKDKKKKKDDDEEDEDNFVLEDLDLVIKKGDLVLIIGKTRSGKSSLLKTILGETVPMSSKHSKITRTSSRISYCDQTVWLENESILNNILMCDESETLVDKKRLSDVLKVCSMEEEISKFQGGLHLEIGDNSLTLSGGQKSRVSLCRAVYYGGDVFLLDNSLSSLDEVVGNNVFQYCILRYLRDKTRILVTNKWEFLPYADQIIMMEDGRVLENGTFEELYQKKGKLYDLIEGQKYEVVGDDDYNLQRFLVQPTLVEDLISPLTSPTPARMEKMVNENVFDEYLQIIQKEKERKARKKRMMKKAFFGGISASEVSEFSEDTSVYPIEFMNNKKKEEEEEEEEELEEGGGENSMESSSSSTTTSTTESEEEEESGEEEEEVKDEVLYKDDEDTVVKVSVSEERVTGFTAFKTGISYIKHTGCLFRSPCPLACCCGCSVISIVYFLYFLFVLNYFANELHISYLSKNTMYMLQYGNEFNSSICNATDNVYQYCEDVEASYYIIDYHNATENVTTYSFIDVYFENVEVFWDLGYKNDTVIVDGITEIHGFIIYSCMLLMFCCLLMCASNIFLNTFLSTSNRMFFHVVHKLFSTSMSFFYSNPTGRILSRLTYDVSRTDFEIVIRLEFMSIIILLVLGAFGQLLLSTYGIFLPCVLIALILLVSVYSFFRRSAIELKRLESISRSQIFNLFHQSLEGMSTIRSFEGYSDRLKKNVEKSIDFQTRVSILLKALYYMMRMNLTMAGVATVFLVCFFSIFFSYYVPLEGLGTLLGLGIVNMVLVVDIIGMIFSNIVNFEVEMNSMERLNYYIRTLKSQEKLNQKKKNNMITKKKKKTLKLKKGEIQFRKFSARYKSNFPYILKEMDITIQHDDKILIIGKTGCGKSSIFNALLGIFDADNTMGQIRIDRKDLLEEHTLESIRKEISIIPQDPVLFTGSLRENVDPEKKYSQELVNKVIELCGLTESVERIPGKMESGKMMEYGKNFSVGEKRLFCLARALVKQSKVILLDECTGIDYNLDMMTQKIVVGLQGVTVLSISHRLSNLVYFDKVLIMDAGEVLEFGQVEDLVVKKEDSHLRKLLEMVPNGRMIFRSLVKKFEKKKKEVEEEVEGEDVSDDDEEESLIGDDESVARVEDLNEDEDVEGSTTSEEEEDSNSI